MDKEALLATLLALDTRFIKEERANLAAIQIPSEALIETFSTLKNDAGFDFDMLLSHTAVHWVEQAQFELIYVLYSTNLKHHLMVTTRIGAESPVVPSAHTLWRVAEWQEREVYDLFGLLYSGHPDLRRLLLEDDWQGFPLRKDYKDDFMLEGP